jgi:hypothetical protein
MTSELWEPPHISNITTDQAYSLFDKFSKTFDHPSQAPDVCHQNCSKTQSNGTPLKTPNSQVHRKFIGNKKPTWE